MLWVGSDTNKQKEYYVDGVTENVTPMYMVDKTAKSVGKVMVASTIQTGLTAYPLYVVESPQGISAGYIYVDGGEAINITGQTNNPGEVVYCAGLQEDVVSMFASPASCQTDENGNFAFEGITTIPRYACWKWNSAGLQVKKLPVIPDEILAEYPYYAVVEQYSTGAYLLCVSNSPMYAVDAAYAISSSYKRDVLYLPGGYKTYTFTEDELTLNSSGSGTGSVVLYNGYIFACNHNVVEESSGTTVWKYGGSTNPLKGRVYLWVYDKAHRATLAKHQFSMLRRELQEEAAANVLVVSKPVPDVSEAEGGGSTMINGGDCMNITVAGTCSADVTEVFVSYADFAEGSTTEIANAAYNFLKSNLICTFMAVDGAFSGEFYGEPYYQPSGEAKCPTTDFSAYAIWCVSESGDLAVTEWSVTHLACLSGDTLIRLADGESKELRLLEVGDEVCSSDGQATRITKLSRGKFNNRHTLYEFNDGTVIDETSDHRFFNATKGYWQKLKRWDVGDCAVKADGTEIALTGRKVVKERVELFGIWTESHDYYANGLLSGDVMANVKLLATATVEQIVDCLGSVEPAKLAKWMEA